MLSERLSALATHFAAWASRRAQWLPPGVVSLDAARAARRVA